MKLNLLGRTSVTIVFFLLLGYSSQAQNNNNEKITIKDFRVARQQDKIAVKWSTEGRPEANYFEVERSVDGKNFKAVAYVLGPDPTLEHDQFSFLEKTDDNAKGYYYRLKHVNTDGIAQFSEIKKLALE